MFSVLFEVRPDSNHWDDYLDRAKMLRPELEQIEGFIDNVRYRSLTREGWILSVSVWRDEKALVRWRTSARHHGVQAEGRAELLQDYRLRVGQITDDTDQAVKIITRFYRNFHSSRFVKDLFVIRLKHAPTDSAITAMNEDFADIIIGPEIKRIDPTPEELADDDNVDMPRISFGFNRRDYGRLRQLIDVLNGL